MQNSTNISISYKAQIVWKNVILYIIFHYIALQGIYYIVTFQVQWRTLLWGEIIANCGGIGITAGSHRLWCHRSYKAKLPLRVLLAMFHNISYQNTILEWVRDHRVHHKFTNTDADPHNSSRGFFFSHMGWLMVRKHPDVFRKGKTVDMSDVEADPVVRFQQKYFNILAPSLSIIFPTVIPWYFWNEDLYISFATAGILKLIISLHTTWLVNSVAHIWGTRPYDKNIKPTENSIVFYLTNGEGWHNYHHCFPWDYKPAELGNYAFTGSLTTHFIDFMAKIGWAYDLKTVSTKMINAKIKNTGNHSLEYEMSKYMS